MIGLFQYYRIVAAYLVLLIHQAFWPGVDGPLTGVAVPIFAAMAGYLAIGEWWQANVKEAERVRLAGEMLRKKIRRILVPYFVWSVIYFILNWVVLDVCIRREAFEFPPFRSWLLGGTACHLWFLPCLFVAFVLAAILMMIRDRRARWAVLFALLLLGCITQMLSGEGSATLSGYVHIYAGRMLIYFVTGGMIRLLIRRLSRLTICGIGMFVTLVGFGNLVFAWWGGLSWQPGAFVVGLIMLAVGVGEVPIPRSMNHLADATMGIYLVHALFTSAANVMWMKFGCPVLSWFWGLLLTIVLYFLSYMSVKLLPKWMYG